MNRSLKIVKGAFSLALHLQACSSEGAEHRRRESSHKLAGWAGRTIIICLLLLASGTKLSAQCVNISGKWSGSDINYAGLLYFFDLSVAQTGCAISGTYTVTAGSACCVGLISAISGSVSGSNVNFLRAGPFITCGTGGSIPNQAFTGTVSSNGQSISGTWTSPPCVGVQTWSVSGQASPLTITTTSLPPGQVGSGYSQSLAATGGVPPYTWSASGSLPTPLALNPSTGVITGIPATPGTFNFTVQVTDSSGATAIKALTINISGCQVNLKYQLGGFDKVTGLPTSIQATASLPSGSLFSSLHDYAKSCGFDGFDWVHVIRQWPSPSALYTELPPHNPGSAMPIAIPPQPAIHDPPLGGWSYSLSQQLPYLGAYPFLYNTQSITTSCAAHDISGNCVLYIQPDAKTLNFYDRPQLTCLPGGPLAGTSECIGTPTTNPPFLADYSTQLVGYCSAPSPACITSAPGTNMTWTPLREVDWIDDFNGTSQGGIVVWNLTASSYPADPGSGTGGVTITSIDGVPQTPPNVSCKAAALSSPNSQSVSVIVSGEILPGTSAIVSSSYAVINEEGRVQLSGSVAIGPNGGYSVEIPFAVRSDLDDRKFIISTQDSISNAGSCTAVVDD